MALRRAGGLLRRSRAPAHVRRAGQRRQKQLGGAGGLLAPPWRALAALHGESSAQEQGVGRVDHRAAPRGTRRLWCQVRRGQVRPRRGGSDPEGPRAHPRRARRTDGPRRGGE